MRKYPLAFLLFGWTLATAAPAPAEDEPDVDCKNQKTQMDMTYCAGQDFVAADDELNAQYKRTRQAMKAWDADASPDLGGAEEALVKAQRAWIAYRDAQCAFHGYQAKGGTMEPMIVSGCKAELTLRRTQELKDQTDLMGN